MADTPTGNRDLTEPPTRLRDIPLWFSVALPAFLMLAFLASGPFGPEAIEWWVAQESGFFEHATVLVLIPGIAAGVWACAKGRRLPGQWLRWWILLWALAALYFAGEEASWGQHWFGWDTPDAWVEHNKQAETNLHNTSSWLNMKPRTAVELWIFVGGVVVPAIQFFKRRRPSPRQARYWFWPTAVGFTAAFMNIVGRGVEVAEDIVARRTGREDPWHNLDSSEAREFFIALFLAFYLVSFALRLHDARKQRLLVTPHPAPSTPPAAST